MRILKIILIVLVGLVVAVAVALQVPAVQRALGRRVLAMVNANIPGELRVGKLRGNLLRELRLSDVEIRYRGGLVARARSLEATWSPLGLLRNRVEIGRLRLEGARLDLIEVDGRMSIAQAFSRSSTEPSPRPATSTSEPLGVTIADLHIERSMVVMAARSVTMSTFAGSFGLAGHTLKIRVGALAGRLDRPAINMLDAHGGVTIGTRGPVTLTFEGFEVRLRESVVRLAGVLAPVGGGINALDVVTAPLAPADAAPLGSPLRIPLEVTARADGPLSGLRWSFVAASTVGSVRAGGWVALPPMTVADRAVRFAADATLASLEPLRWIGRPAGKKTRLTGTLHAEGRMGERRRITATFDGKSSLVGGAPVRSFSVAGGLHGNVADLQVRLRSVRGTARADGRIDWDRRSYRADLRVSGLHPDDWLGEPWPGVVTFTAAIAGSGFTLAALRGRALIRVAPSRVAGLHIVRAVVPLTVADGRLLLRDAVVDSDALDARVSGDVALTAERRGILRALVRSDDWGDLMPAVPDAEAEGRAMLHLRAAGSPDDMRVTLTAHGNAVKFRTLALPDIDVAAEAQHVDVLHGRGRGELLATAVAPVYGDLGLRKVTLRLDYERRPRIDVGSVVVEALGESAANEVRGRFEVAHPGVLVTLEHLALTVAGSTWRNQGEARIDTRGPGVRVNALDLRSGEQRIFVDGQLDPEGRDNLRVLVNRVDAAPFGPLLRQSKNFAGRLNGTIWVAGTPTAPQIDATLALTDLRIAEYRVDLVTVVIDFRAEAFGVQVRLVQQGGGGMLRADARIPLTFVNGKLRLADRAVTGDIVSDGVSLRLLYALGVPVEDAAGEVALDVKIRGTPRAPRLLGALRVNDGKLNVPALGVAYRSLVLDVRFRGTYVELVRLRVESGKDEELTARGTVGIALGRPGALALHVVARRFHAADNDLADGRIDADLWLRGTLARPTVTGSLATAGVTVTPPSTSKKQLEPLVFNVPGIHVVGAPQEIPDGKRGPRDIRVPILQRAAIDVRLRVKRNTWVRNADLNVELNGEVRAYKPAGEPSLRLIGEITTVRGTYRLQGRRLTLQEGTLAFTGESEINPRLDVTLSYQVPEYEIAANVTGTTRKPVLKLTSIPPLEEADILAVLLFGRPFNQLGGGEQVEMRQRVGQLLGGFAAAELRKKLGGKLGFDTLEIKPSSASGGAELGVGKYVSNDIFLQYVQRFGAEAASEVRLEYYFRTHWLVQTAAATDGNSGADIFWHVKF